MSENKEQIFPDWFKGFLARNGGYAPNRIDLWEKRVNLSHNKVRSLIKGDLIQRFYDIQSGQERASIDEVRDTAKSILGIIPSYLRDNNLDESVFTLPMITQGTHNAIKLGKHIRRYAQDFLGKESGKSVEQLEKLVSDLGNVWNRHKTSNSSLEITLSTTPKGFCLLGHYGPDKDSCFRQGSDKTFHKFILGQSHDTCVITIAKKRNDGKYENVARCIAFIGFSGERPISLNAFNYYFAPTFQEGDAIEAISKLASEILKTDKIYFYENIARYGRDVFINPDYGRWTFSIYDEPVQSKIEFSANNITYFACLKCANQTANDLYWQEIDDQFVCEHCAESANRCEVSGKKTFLELITISNEDGTESLVCKEVADKMSECPVCHLKCSGLKDVGQEQLCGTCFSFLYEQCDMCGKMEKEEKVSDVDGEVYCSECSYSMLGIEV